MPTRFNRPAASSRDSHESADTPKQALFTLAHPGKIWRRVILPTPTSRIMSMRFSACSVQGNGRTGALRPLPNRRAQYSGQFVWSTSTLTGSSPLGMGFYPVSRQQLQSHLLIFFVFSFQGSALFSGWTVRCRGLFSSTLGALDIFSHSPGSSSPWWSSFTSSPRVTPTSLVLSPPASQSSPVSSRSLFQ